MPTPDDVDRVSQEREDAGRRMRSAQELAQKALEKTAKPQRTLSDLFAGDDMYEHFRVTIGDVGDETRSLDLVRKALRRYEPELWAAFMHRAIGGGRNCQGAERAVLAALYGWGVTRDETDQEAIERMKRAMGMVEESAALTEDQLFEASARFVGKYISKHPHGWDTLNRYLPAEATEGRGDEP